MLTIEKVVTLSRVDLFAGLSGESLAEIAAVPEEVEIAQGQTVPSEGERSSTMYVVAAGKIQIRDEDRIKAEFGPGEAFGVICALDPREVTTTAVALEDSLLLKIEHEVLFDLISEDVELAKAVIRSLCRREGISK